MQGRFQADSQLATRHPLYGCRTNNPKAKNKTGPLYSRKLRISKMSKTLYGVYTLLYCRSSKTYSSCHEASLREREAVRNYSPKTDRSLLQQLLPQLCPLQPRAQVFDPCFIACRHLRPPPANVRHLRLQRREIVVSAPAPATIHARPILRRWP